MTNSKVNHHQMTEALELLIGLMERDARLNDGYWYDGTAYLYAATKYSSVKPSWLFKFIIPTSDKIIIAHDHMDHRFLVDLHTNNIQCGDELYVPQETANADVHVEISHFFDVSVIAQKVANNQNDIVEANLWHVGRLENEMWRFVYQVRHANPNTLRWWELLVSVNPDTKTTSSELLEPLRALGLERIKSKKAKFRTYLRYLKDRLWIRRLYATMESAWRFRNAPNLVEPEYVSNCINLLEALGNGEIEKDKEIRDGIRLSHIAIMTLREISTNEALAAAQQIIDQLSDDEKTILDDLAERWEAILDDWYADE